VNLPPGGDVRMGSSFSHSAEGGVTAAMSAFRADHVRALWRVAGADDAIGIDRVQAVLEMAARTLRPGKSVCAYLSHQSGGALVIDAVAFVGIDDTSPAATLLYRQAEFAIERTMERLIGTRGRTLALNDLSDYAGRGMVYEEAGFRSLIGTSVQIGRQTHYVAFASTDDMTDAPFGDDDLAYIEILAAFAAHRFLQQRQVERAQHRVEYDALTGLQNRFRFLTAIGAELTSGTPFAVALFDVDAFRRIDEFGGRPAGDEMLLEVAAAIRRVDDRDAVARLGGDAFGIILRDVADQTDAHERLLGYVRLFDLPFHTGERSGIRMQTVGAAFGVVLAEPGRATAEDLVRSADVALHEAKLQGGSAVVFFTPALGGALEERSLRFADLATAIDDDALTVAYQPTFNLATRRVDGAEALVRWNHPLRGPLAPLEFVPFAERNGLLGHLSHWVVRRVMSEIAGLTTIPGDFRCSVNIGADQIDDLAFIAELEGYMRFSPQVARHLGIEIAESAVLRNLESSIHALERFRDAGLHVAIDRFGSGHASLSNFKHVPVDTIKIDREIVAGLPAGEKDAALCEMLLHVAARSGLTALATGIETDDQSRWLSDHGCQRGQGFLVSRPLPFDAFAALLGPAAGPR
jgi:diguanylate cyclase (GGDEF)-like protein